MILGVVILFILIGISTYLIILGGSKNKTKEEQRLEDEEQIRYLENYKTRRK